MKGHHYSISRCSDCLTDVLMCECGLTREYGPHAGGPGQDKDARMGALGHLGAMARRTVAT